MKNRKLVCAILCTVLVILICASCGANAASLKDIWVPSAGIELFNQYLIKSSETVALNASLNAQELYNAVEITEGGALKDCIYTYYNGDSSIALSYLYDGRATPDVDHPASEVILTVDVSYENSVMEESYAATFGLVDMLTDLDPGFSREELNDIISSASEHSELEGECIGFSQSFSDGAYIFHLGPRESTSAGSSSESESTKWVCAACGKTDRTGNFCKSCGAPRPADSWMCPKCNIECKNKFCPNCGTARTDAASVSDASAINVQEKPEVDDQAQMDAAWEYFGRQDYENTMKCCVIAADLGNAEAQQLIGWMYENGLGVERDIPKAIEFYTKAADQGNAEAQYNLGWLYCYAANVDQDFKKAADLFERAAEQGLPDAQTELAKLYENGAGVETDYKKAFEWYSKAAEQGNSSAMIGLGYLYLGFENGIDPDYDKAYEWFGKAADLGDMAAYTFIGEMYQTGSGVDQDYAKALEWLTPPANQGSVEAQNRIAWLYIEGGHGITQSYEKAVEWFKRAADQGEPMSQWNLGYMYYYGEGVQQDMELAKLYLEKAAAQGSIEAQNLLDEAFAS